MEHVVLEAKPRPKLKGKQLLRQQLVPAVIYGHGFDTEPVVVGKTDFHKVYGKAGHSTLVDIKPDKGLPFKVLIHQIQYHPLTDQPIHVDFYRVKMTEKIKTEIPLKLVGEAPAVEDLQGILIQNKDHVRVEALPQDLIHEIEVDISRLKTFEDKIQIKDLKIPQGIELLDDPEGVVALVQPPRSEEELAELEEKPEEDVETVEVEAKGKVEVEAEPAAEGQEQELKEETVGGEQSKK